MNGLTVQRMQQNDVTTAWQQYEEGLSYQKRMGFTTQFPLYERFKDGDQWPAPTKRTKNLPRPVFNIVDFFIRTKRANLLNQPVLMTFKPAEITGQEGEEKALHAAQGAKDYTDFAGVLWQAMEQEELSAQFLDDAITLGTGVLHYYWDNEASGGRLFRYKGDLRGEVIDPLNILFGNPQCQDLQRQPYILLVSRDRVGAVKRLAEQNGLPSWQIEQIRPDNDRGEYDALKQEDGTQEKITVLTKYFRKDGEVYFLKAVKNAEIVPPRPLTPDPMAVKLGPEDLEEPSEPDLPEKPQEKGYRMELYPLVLMNWRRRKGSIFGLGEAADLITINKTYNFLKAMMVLSVQQTAWPKLLKKPGALKQEVTNEPGEILTDYSQTGDGVKYMQPPSFSAAAENLAGEMFQMARIVSGVTDVASGEAIGGNMAASAIIALQNQARTPIKEMQKRYYRAIRQVGKIWEQFFKAYYTLPRAMTVETPGEPDQTRLFEGSLYQDVDFRLGVDVGSGSDYGEELAMTTLDKFYDRGEITLDQYIELAPQNVVPFKEQLKKLRQEASGVPPQLVKALGENPPLLQAVAAALAGKATPAEPEEGEG